MKKCDLEKRKEHLEIVNEQLLGEIAHLDQLMRLVGFTDGLETLKATARDLIKSEQEMDSDEEDQEAA